MKELKKSIIKKVAAEYGMDADYLKDTVRDMENDGILVSRDDLVDMIVNGDC
jgi:hypothetical protein